MDDSNAHGPARAPPASSVLARYYRLVVFAFYQTFADIAPPLKVSKSKGSTYRRAYRLSFQALHLLNLLSLAFPLSLRIPGYDPDFVLWKVFTYSRYDAVLVAFGSAESALILAYCLTFTPLIVVLISVSTRLAYPSMNLNFLRYVLKASLRLLDEAFIVPTAIVLWTAFMGAFLGNDFSFIYPVDPGKGLGNGNYAGVSLVALVGLMGVLIVQRTLLFDICWLNADSDIFARYSSSAHTRAVLCNVLLCISTSLWQGDYFRTQSVIAAFAALYSCYKFTYVMPFYHPVTAIVVPTKYLIFVFAVSERLFAEYLESENTAWTLLICLLPADILLYYYIYQWRLRMLDPNDPDWTVRVFQLIVIQRLMGPEEMRKHDDMQRLFHMAKVRFPRKAQIPLFESLYFLFAKKNAEVAQLKASLTPVSASSLQSSFLRYRLVHHFHSSSPNEKHLYVFFNSLYDTVLKYDEYFCYRFSEFLSEVASWHKTDLTHSCESFSAALETLENQYLSLLVEFPRDVTVLNMFAGFLEDVKKDSGRAMELRKRVDTVQKNGKKGPFDQDYPLFICEAVGDRKIIFKNARFDEMMKFKGERLMAEDLNGLLPGFVREVHGSRITKVLSASDKTMYKHEDVFLMKTGLIGVLVNLTAEFIAVAGHAYMVVVIHPKDRYMECAAVRDGTLLACSEHFMRLMGVAEVPSGPVPLEEVLPHFDIVNGIAEFSQRSPLETTQRDVCIGNFQYTIVEAFNFNLRARSRKSSIAPTFTLPRPDLSKFMETHDYEANTTKGFTATTSCPKPRDRHKTRKREIVRLSNYLMMILGAQVVLLIIESFIMFACYFGVVDDMDTVDAANELGIRRFYDAKIVASVRQLHLLQSGFTLLDTESFIRSSLQSTIASYTIVLSHIRDNSTHWLAGPSKDLYYEPVVPIWILTNENIEIKHCSLFDAMSTFLLRAQSIAESDIRKLKKEDLFYVYQNGLGETMDYLNRSTFMHIKETQSDQLTKTKVLFYLSVFLVLGICLGSSFLLILVIVKLERKYSECWLLISATSTTTIQRLWEIVRNRLECVHGIDVLPDIPPKKRQFVKGFSRRYQKLIAVLTVFTLVSIAYFIYVYISASNYVFTSMVTKANYMNWAGLRRALTTLLSTLVLEHYLSTSPEVGYFAVTPSGQKIGDFREMIRRVVGGLENAERISVRGDGNAGVYEVDMSDRHRKLLFGDVCEALNITACEHSSISKGGHIALLDYILSVSAMTQSISESLSTWSEVLALDHTGSNLGLTFSAAAAAFSQDSSQALDSFRALLWTFPGVYLVVTIVILPALILPIKARYKGSLLAVWRTSGFFVND